MVNEYAVETTTVHLGGRDFQVRALRDLTQYADPDGVAERAGISSASWPMFGVLWHAGRVLAEAMGRFPVEGKRILEVGCGLGLASLVLKSRGADVTASDRHPLAKEFLLRNAELNGLEPPAYVDAPWETDNPQLGYFDLVIGADVLYERDHVALLAAFLERHVKPTAEIVVTEPGRGHANTLTRALAAQGFDATEHRCRFSASDHRPFKGRLIVYRRGIPAGNVVTGWQPGNH